MSEELIQIFAECTEAIEQGHLSVDDCLEKYPQYRTELIDLLQVVTRARAVPTAYPPTEFRMNARTQLMSKLPPRTAHLNGSASPTAGGALAASGATASSSTMQQLWERLLARWPYPQVHPVAAGLALLIALLMVGAWANGRFAPAQPQLAETEPSEAVAVVVEEAENEEAPAAEPAVAENETGSTPTDEQPVAVAEPTESDGVAAEATAGETSVYLPFMTKPLALSPQTAVLEVQQGVVELQAEDGGWNAVDRAASVGAGQRLRTGAFSSATLTFFDGSVATLSENSELSLETVDAQRRDEGLRTIVMTQWRGDSEHDVDFRNDSGSRYEVKSPSGSGVARGTLFKVRVRPNVATQYTVLEGKVDVSNPRGLVSLVAGQLTVVSLEAAPLPPAFYISGEGIVAQTGENWQIGEQTFRLTDQTVVVGNPRQGDLVRVEGRLTDGGERLADLIVRLQPNPNNIFSITGEVESQSEGTWTVAGQTVLLADNSSVPDEITVGDAVLVEGTVRNDGTLVARRITLLDERLTFTFGGVVEQKTDSFWVVSGQQIGVTSETAVNGAPAVGDVVSVSGTIVDNFWTASSIRLINTATPTFELTGYVQSVMPLQVAGVTLATRSLTAVPGDLAIGDRVRVSGRILPDGSRLVTQIVVLEEERGKTAVLIGILRGNDPWTVNRIRLVTDGNSLIAPMVKAGRLVYAEVALQPDGSWLVLSINLLNPQIPTVVTCFTISDRVVRFNQNQITLANWSTITVADEQLNLITELRSNSIVRFQFCSGFEEPIIIRQLVIIYQPVVIIIDDGGSPPLPSGCKITPKGKIKCSDDGSKKSSKRS